MKTTIVLRDDLFRRTKARAAMLGRPMSRYIEGCLEKALEDGEPSAESFADWAASLPTVTDAALGDLSQVLEAKDFREIEPSMWK